MIDIDFSPLANAIQQLEKSLRFATSDLAKSDPDLFEQFRNSVIQCFEFTYELIHKMLKRYLEATAANPQEIEQASFQNLIRIGNERGLLRSDWLQWRTYRQARTDTSHAYDLHKAQAIYDIAFDFALEARFLYQQLTAQSQDA
ncbi:HI0074 family nucleotidyltransferase substrate-binding subunit [Methylocucumis oryzae]|uniref:Nucleotidyltransferase n=1 Tax=Methylocucumis oryzae TaxID=1632867 RepID=A0A0F3IKY7_9GAMM|nr:HI0074 family nucleotidyltransferase substrate-binding subunit [Methylocucumis oryzae]KJV07381.1 nucleotidyltransferase [Methylocucumis oryzae]